MPGAYLRQPVLRQAHVRRSAIRVRIEQMLATEKNLNKLTDKYAWVKVDKRNNR